ncbi:MAG TPA: HTTM domain-containing protein [Verrucomicrobiae bacterium]|nr:HTTM domain-containing protein [Verrucomicrobiae bacterium]
MPGLRRRLFSPVDIAPLVFFRITFGALMAMEVLGCAARGLVRDNWIRPEIHFTYFGFGWIQPPPDNWTYGLVAAVSVAAIGIMFGAFYRLSAAVFAVGFTWFYLIEQSQYLNHFYLISLLGFVAFAIPAHRAFSIDARRKPELPASTAPTWSLWLLQAHIAIAYFFGGVAKLNRDWLRGEPVRTWLESGSLGKKLGPMFQNEFCAFAISYSGLLIDLLVVPFLLWKKTRLAALIVAIAFHLSNAYLFDIGVFPFLSIAMTCLFLEPAWHRKLLRLGRPSEPTPLYWKNSRVVVSLLCVYMTYHLFMPFRHLFYPGSSHWSEEGHRYSWHMMLRTKNGRAYFIVDDRTTGRLWKVRPEEYLSQRQFTKMAVHPEMLWQFAKYLREKWGPNDVKVHAIAWVRLNDHKPALLVDPEVDLSKEELSLKSSKWILPLENDRIPPRRFSAAHPAPKK